MEIKALHKLFLSSSGVTTDTRNIQPNSIFFALKGANFNGNRFANEAVKKGASHVIIDDAAYSNEKTILVSNVLQTLQQLAVYHRQQLTIPVIGLTGSNGKTTTKELICAALKTKYHVQATKGNLNNHIGVPLTLLSIHGEHEIAVIEMGANHQKEIEFLSSLAKPNIGYITNFGKAHLEGFGGVEGVIKGKSELYQFLRAQGETALINLNDSIQVEKAEGLKQITFGSADADYNFKPLQYGTNNLLGLIYKNQEVKTHLTGDYNFSNLSAAVALALHFNIPIKTAAVGLESYVPENNRSQFKAGNNNTLLLDAYNANPSSMEVALQNFAHVEAMEKWVILGDMFELGEAAYEEHRKIALLATELNFEKIILAGKHFSELNKEHQFEVYESTELLYNALAEAQPKGKTILIKGSRGMALERLVPLL